MGVVYMIGLKTNENHNHVLFEEHDSCGIVAVIERAGIPTYQNLDKAIDSLVKLEHRAGFIDGEGDGSGVLTDIPRKVWARKLKKQNQSAQLAFDPRFIIAHLFIDSTVNSIEQVKDQIREKFTTYDVDILLEEENQVLSQALGPNGKAQEPTFWQVALFYKEDLSTIRQQLFSLLIDIEQNTFVHVASLSNYTVVYKVMGDAKVLKNYYLDLNHPAFESTVTIGHNRYSTNTLSHFFRVQPFSLLGHNGEINTIQRLRDEATMLHIPLVYEGSDSQDLNRLIEGIMVKQNLSLFEVMDMIFPPIYNEIRKMDKKFQDMYTFLRHLWGPFAQGPAGIISRYENQCLFSVDAMGLRPLWKVETEETLYFSSEQGIVNTLEMISEPKPFAPGEKIGVVLNPGHPIQVIGHHQLQELNYQDLAPRYPFKDYHQKLEVPKYQKTTIKFPSFDEIPEYLYHSLGWEKEQIQNILKMAEAGNEPVSSLGYDGPLAVLSKERVNLADFLKETVAVVTNPAVDREREIEHFSTRTIVGGRENFTPHQVGDISFEIRTPILLEGKIAKEIVEELGTTSLEQTIEYFTSYSNNSVAFLTLSFSSQQTLEERLTQLKEQAVAAVTAGAKIIILDDHVIFQEKDQLWLDPHLAVSTVDITLRDLFDEEESLRRKVSLILRSSAIRHLHDLITAIGLGADAVSPYLLFATPLALGNKEQNQEAIKNLYTSLNKGLEKVISTLGIHELRGYERLFSSIGLHKEIADILNITNFYGNESTGFSFHQLEKDARKRKQELLTQQGKLKRSFHIIPKIWKEIGGIGNGTNPYPEYAKRLSDIEKNNPISLRHILDFQYSSPNISTIKKPINIGIGEHDLPFIISSMSFGSQNETTFRAYAEAAYQLNMMSLSGEGGEIKDMLGKYPKNRGMQIASGRFGVNIEFINSSEWIEVKIGQGAKPGEGGHLPGKKVTEKVAAARNATPGKDLISPSNNHDIYSIEDLAQIIAELKTANKRAKVIVKVPVVPNIGTIAVGIAKAGADVVSLSGYDGGTGAARAHALQHVGLPIEIGVKLSHLSLIHAGLRDRVEIWADGGIRSGKDVVKLVLLGANRIGFGTLAMMAVGCTSCRGCHLGTCHVGISTQIETVEEATSKGLKRFSPRIYQDAVTNLKRLFSAIGEEVKEITHLLGSDNLQNLVGRSDLLVQQGYDELLDLEGLLVPAAVNQSIINSYSSHSVENQLLMAAGAEEFDCENIEALTQIEHTINSTHRLVGSRISGERTYRFIKGKAFSKPSVKLTFKKGSIAGNGLAAYLAEGIRIRIHGGAQDGVGKTGYGGKVSIMKTVNKDGVFLNGSVGKGFCYGAQKGLFMIQGNADSRAGIRLSGADVIIGGEVTAPLQDHLGAIGERANIKGFAFEYMTGGRAVVMGDPGPWICSGMTGGAIYQRLVPEFGLNVDAIKRRIAKGANVQIVQLDQQGKKDLTELLQLYTHELLKSKQNEVANRTLKLLENLEDHFVRILPSDEV